MRDLDLAQQRSPSGEHIVSPLRAYTEEQNVEMYIMFRKILAFRLLAFV